MIKARPLACCEGNRECVGKTLQTVVTANLLIQSCDPVADRLGGGQAEAFRNTRQNRTCCVAHSDEQLILGQPRQPVNKIVSLLRLCSISGSLDSYARDVVGSQSFRNPRKNTKTLINGRPARE